MMGESVSTIKSKANVYRDLCEAIDQNYSLDICVVNDMRQCQEDDVSLFVFLLPDIYKNFTKHTVGNVDLLYLVVSCVDGKQVQTLVCHVVARDFIMFKKDSVQGVLTASLGWETFEQYALWQLISAHDLPFDSVLPMVPKLNASRHSEALTSVLLLIRQERPTADLLKNLMAREVSEEDRFVSSCLVNWMHEYEDKLGDMVSNHLSKTASGGGGSMKTDVGNKRKRGTQNMKNGTLSHAAELTLSHLDQLRQTCTQYDFFEQRGMQSALQQVRHSCTESQKKQFMDLFALADSDSEDESPPVKSSKGSGSSSKSGDKGSGSGSGSGGGKGNNNSSSLSASSKSSPAKSSSKSSNRIHHHSSHGSHHSSSSSSTVQKMDSSSNSASSKNKVEQLVDSSDASSDDSDESEKPLKGSKMKSNKSGSNKHSGGNKSLHNNPRKRGKISYKEMESTDESSDEDHTNEQKTKATPKKRKKAVQSDSDE